jgi:hypothetical protein
MKLRVHFFMTSAMPAIMSWYPPSLIRHRLRKWKYVSNGRSDRHFLSQIDSVISLPTSSDVTQITSWLHHTKAWKVFNILGSLQCTHTPIQHLWIKYHSTKTCGVKDLSSVNRYVLVKNIRDTTTIFFNCCLSVHVDNYTIIVPTKCTSLLKAHVITICTFLSLYS